MPPFTKRAIVDAFLQIVAKKPFDKITVRDIVDFCGINRNTFYYYFQDIFGVLEELFGGDRPIFGEDIPLFEGFSELLLFTGHNRRSMQSIYLSVGGDGILKYLFPSVKASSLASLSASGAFQDTDAADLSFFADALSHATIGLYLDWLRASCRENPEVLEDNFQKLLHRLLSNA